MERFAYQAQISSEISEFSELWDHSEVKIFLLASRSFYRKPRRTSFWIFCAFFVAILLSLKVAKYAV